MEKFSSLLTLFVEKSPVTGEFHTQRPVTWRFNVFFDLEIDFHYMEAKRGLKTRLGSVWNVWFLCRCGCNIFNSVSTLFTVARARFHDILSTIFTCRVISSNAFKAMKKLGESVCKFIIKFCLQRTSGEKTTANEKHVWWSAEFWSQQNQDFQTEKNDGN